MQPVSLLIFDLDGTLVDTLDDIAASVNHTLASLGRPPIPREAVRQYVGDGVEKLIVRSLGGYPADIGKAVSVYGDHHRRNLSVHSRLYPAVREMLDHFSSIPLAVISNKTMEFVGPLLESLSIKKNFGTIIGADSGMPLKPAPDAVLRIMEHYHAPKDRTAIVGDGTTDVRAGKAAGVITCSVTYGFRPEEELRRAGPDYVIHSLAELEGIFRPEK